jgi:MFS family permease
LYIDIWGHVQIFSSKTDSHNSQIQNTLFHQLLLHNKMHSLETKRKIIYLLAGLIPEALLESTLVPLFPYITKHLLPNEKEADLGRYSGLLGSSFYLPLFLMNLVWGYFSDKYGRKKILIIGLVMMGLTTIGLGFSESFYLTLFCRFVAGLFGANSTVTKGYIGHLARDQRSRAWGYAMYGSVYGISGMLGPLIGGLLANPAELYPETFDKDGFFGKYPFMLVCMFVFVLNTIAFFIITFLLVEGDDYEQIVDQIHYEEEVSIELETRGPNCFINEAKTDTEDELRQNYGEVKANNSLSLVRKKPSFEDEDITTVDTSRPQDDETFKFFTWNTLGPIFLYCTIAYTNMTYATALPLFFSTSTKNGGLGLNSRETSFSFTTLSATKLFVQFFMYDLILLRIGNAKKTFQKGMMLYLPNHFLIPFFAKAGDTLRSLMIFLVMVSFGACESLGYCSVILMITESQAVVNLGKAHGLASTFSALARTIAPAIAGSLWAWGITLQWPWLVFFFGGAVSLMGVISSSEGSF